MTSFIKTCVLLLALLGMTCGVAAIFEPSHTVIDLTKTGIIITEKQTKISSKTDSDTRYLIQTVRIDDHGRIFRTKGCPIVIITDDKFGNVGDVIKLVPEEDND